MSLIRTEDFQKIENFAETVSKPDGDKIEENTRDIQRDNPDYKFLWDRYSVENKYYNEYLSRLRKIKDADEILFDAGTEIEDKRVNIRRKCLALVEMKRCGLTVAGERKVDAVLKNLQTKADRNQILAMKRELESCREEARSARDIFSLVNMKLFYRTGGKTREK